MWHLPPLRQIYFSVFEICLLFASRKFVSSVGFDQIYGRSYKLQHHLGQKPIVLVNWTRYNRPFLDTLALVTILYYITLPSLAIDHTTTYTEISETLTCWCISTPSTAGQASSDCRTSHSISRITEIPDIFSCPVILALADNANCIV